MECHPIIEFEHVSFRYNGQYVLEDVSLHVHEREFGWIVGPNARGRIGYMPQRFDLDSNYPARAIDVVLMGRLGHANRFGFYSKEDRRIAEESLEQVGLGGLAGRPFSDLSGGQQRRLRSARSRVLVGRSVR